MKRKILKAADLVCFFIYNRIAMLFLGLDHHKVLFISESHMNLDGNLKAVHDALDPAYTAKVYVKSDRRENESFFIKLRLWKDLTTAAYIFLDDFYGLTSALKLRNGQELIQLWHGCGAFKKFGFSRIGTGDDIKSINSGYRKYTKVSVTSENVRSCFAEAFDIPLSHVKAAGSPRTDMFFDQNRLDEAKKRIYTSFPELINKKIILIAPTYRGRKVEEASYDFEKLDLERLAYGLGDDWEIITKWHPALYSNISRGICSTPKAWDNCSNIRDASAYGDINDLLTVTDVLVTDYSSVIFDYFLLNKPVVYFIYDKEDYSQRRGLYFDFDQYIYGDVVYDSIELVSAVKKGDMHWDKRENFRSKFMSACDGHSTERVIQWVFGGNKI